MAKELEIIKQVPIVDILERLGHQGTRSGGRIMFKAPWRDENNASMGVDPKLNLWCDYGEDFHGGSNLDLVMRLGLAKDIDEAADWIMDHFMKGMPLGELKLLREHSSRPHAAKEPALWVTKAEAITSKALKKYAKKRGVAEDILVRFCKEVIYANRNRSNETRYGIGLQNRSGGWSIRSSIWKVSVSPIDITVIHGEDNGYCIVFEGMFDFLSYATQQGTLPCDIIILNSVSNKQKAVSILEMYAEIDGYLDNDKAGDEATLYFKDKFNDKFTDMRGIFKGFNDYNEYHLSMLMQAE